MAFTEPRFIYKKSMTSLTNAPVFLRPMDAEDCGDVAMWLADPDIRRFLTSNLRSGGLDAQHLRVGLRRPDQRWFLFADTPNAPVCGLVALDSIDLEDGVANLWFALGDKCLWGKGITNRAIDTLCCNHVTGLHVITAWVIDGNHASLRCLEKSGFKEVGRYHGASVIEGVRKDRILMERLISST